MIRSNGRSRPARPASPRAELAAVLSGNQPVAEILAAQAPAAPQATPQAPLQPAAFGWPDIKTPAVATLPDGQIITGQIAGIQDSGGQPMARFVELPRTLKPLPVPTWPLSTSSRWSGT